MKIPTLLLGKPQFIAPSGLVWYGNVECTLSAEDTVMVASSNILSECSLYFEVVIAVVIRSYLLHLRHSSDVDVSDLEKALRQPACEFLSFFSNKV